MNRRASDTALPRFLVPAPVRAGDRLRLPPREARHARARRVRPGDAVIVIDGRGHGHLARVAAAGPRAVEVAVGEPRPAAENESPLRLTLACALFSSNRMDWAVEKATELGVARIVPVLARRSVVRAAATRIRRWRALAEAAAKQCARSAVPDVGDPVPLERVLGEPADRRLLLAPGAGRALAAAARGAGTVRSAIVAVGPEGGWAPGEREAAEEAGFAPLSLGPRILRAETAAVVAVALCQALWGDLAGEVHQ